MDTLGSGHFLLQYKFSSFKGYKCNGDTFWDQIFVLIMDFFSINSVIWSVY